MGTGFRECSLATVDARTSDLTVKEAFYAMLESVVDQCPRRDTLLVLGDFNALIGVAMKHVSVPMGLVL